MTTDNWISVKDRLPDESIHVRWLCADGVEDVGFFFKEKGNLFATWDLCSYSEVTHWQPLPEPPKEKQQTV
jgi:hypothetical protein